MIARHRLRHLLLLGALALSLAASVGSGGPDSTSESEVVAAVVRDRVPTPPPQDTPRGTDALARLDPKRLEARYEDRRFPDLLAPRSWAPPPPPPPKPVAVKPVVAPPPPPPTAPPLPFQYAGRLSNWGDKPFVYLMRGNEILTVSPGDTIAETYRLESVSDTALTFVYLPLNQTQTLAIPQR